MNKPVSMLSAVTGDVCILPPHLVEVSISIDGPSITWLPSPFSELLARFGKVSAVAGVGASVMRFTLRRKDQPIVTE
jgi:hypothetical protein